MVEAANLSHTYGAQPVDADALPEQQRITSALMRSANSAATLQCRRLQRFGGLFERRVQRITSKVHEPENPNMDGGKQRG